MITFYSNEPVFKIGEAARQLRVAVPTIRMYEKAGLIIPFRTKTGRRMYSSHDIYYLLMIQDMIRNHKLNLEAIKKLLSIIPCWMIKNCTYKTFHNCSAYNENSIPCWLKGDTACFHSIEECRNCKVYKNCPSILKDPKSLFKFNNSNY
ncbi:MerR family transcriptional regulator [candidate division KSB1 bacterium]|nr:MerR family transcriptional regulator [candidate division KSB1 bacterium]